MYDFSYKISEEDEGCFTYLGIGCYFRINLIKLNKIFTQYTKIENDLNYGKGYSKIYATGLHSELSRILYIMFLRILDDKLNREDREFISSIAELNVFEIDPNRKTKCGFVLYITADLKDKSSETLERIISIFNKYLNSEMHTLHNYIMEVINSSKLKDDIASHRSGFFRLKVYAK